MSKVTLELGNKSCDTFMFYCNYTVVTWVNKLGLVWSGSFDEFHKTVTVEWLKRKANDNK